MRPCPAPWLSLLLLIAVLAPAQRADAEIHRCAGADGKTIYTDRACADIGAVERLPSVGAANAGSRAGAPGCSRSLPDLFFELTAAIDNRDANRLAGIYDWAGMSNRSGYAVLGRLAVIASRPLVDVRPILPAPDPPEPSLPIDADDGTDVGGDVDAQGGPATTVDRTPVALQVDQTLANGSTPSRTVFGLRRRMGCWWITF